VRHRTLVDIHVGYLPCDSRAADILYNIISRRHEQRSTVISTNLAFKQ
jgi:DNA replication protein DnaC